MIVDFRPPLTPAVEAVHHARAAAQNTAVAEDAVGQLRDALSGGTELKRILLKAAAGAGKSYVLKRLVADAIQHPRCLRVGVIAFQNRQMWPIAASLGETIGKDAVCLFVSQDRYDDVPGEVQANAHVVTTTSEISQDCTVIVSTSHKLGAFGERSRMLSHFGTGVNGESPFDVLFVDEAWQLPHHLFDRIVRFAPIAVGVGDVGQLPPLEIGSNPWRGDSRYNPYRAWPTEYAEDHDGTWATELPAVWRPTAEQLPLWRAFYPEWGQLNCVAAPGDRRLVASGLTGLAEDVWQQVGTGVPTLLEVDGLPAPEAADVDLPLMQFVESLLDELFAAGLSLERTHYDDAGTPSGETLVSKPGDEAADTLVAVLATRNQAVDDATDAVERLREKHGLSETDLVASTVDSWQGQTNGITVAVHPLTGAAALDEFNSAFGRLAVTCTRATNGLLMVSRPGLDQLIGEAPARSGTPFGEPGNRHLPRQTHQRILATFARGTVNVTASTAQTQ
jgi:hypothetical protein